jgi:hypothetical protein
MRVGIDIGRPRPSGPEGDDPGGGGYLRAAIPIIIGALFLGLGLAAVDFLPGMGAAIAVGLLVSAGFSYVVLIAMPRATQLSLMGAAIGVSADAGYAKLNDQTPITVANALVKMADSITEGVGLIAADAKVNLPDLTPWGVWAFILSLIAFMGFSFLIRHDF